MEKLDNFNLFLKGKYLVIQKGKTMLLIDDYWSLRRKMRSIMGQF
jgi:hypothetical protein